MADIEFEKVEEGDEEEVSGIFSSELSREGAIAYARSEFDTAYNEWEEDRIRWKKWRRQLKVKPARKTKRYPFPNSSNVAVPLLKSLQYSIFGKLKGMFGARRPFWVVKSSSSANEEVKSGFAVLGKYLSKIADDPEELNLERKQAEILSDVSLMGLSAVKVPYTRLGWKFVSDSEGNRKSILMDRHNGPDIVPIPREDFLYRKGFTDLQTAPWVAHLVHLSHADLLQRRDIYENVDEIVGMGREASDDMYTSGNFEGEKPPEGGSSKYTQIYDLVEMYLFWDVDDDGIVEDVILTFHLQTGIVLAERFNDLGRRPFVAFRYGIDTFQIEGSGVGESCEQMQDEADSIHNLRNDNMKVANMRMFAVRAGTDFAKSGPESIYPGKKLIVGDPSRDIIAIQLGEVYPSSLQAEQGSVGWATKAVGMPEPMMGFADSTLGSRDTYRGQNSRMQMGQGIFSSVAEGLTASFSELGILVVMQMIRHKDEIMEKEMSAGRMSAEELLKLGKVLEIPVEELPRKALFEVKTTDVETSFETKRQNYLMMTQLFAQFAQQTAPLAQMILGPQAAQMAQQAPDLYQHFLSVYVGATKMMASIFGLFQDEDVDKLVPQVDKQEAMLELMRGMMAQQTAQLKQASEQMKGGMNDLGAGASAKTIATGSGDLGGIGAPSGLGTASGEGLPNGGVPRPAGPVNGGGGAGPGGPTGPGAGTV